MTKAIASIAICLLCAFGMNAQIAYQVTLMDQSKGTPRANETVSATVTISDNNGKILCTTTESVTTNDFGMLSIKVGNSESFESISQSSLPLWVEAKVGGVTIGKSQILNVPVAEYARHSGQLTKEILCRKTWNVNGRSYCFYSSGRAKIYYRRADGEFRERDYNYHISGDFVYLAKDYTGDESGDDAFYNTLLFYIPEKDHLSLIKGA